MKEFRFVLISIIILLILANSYAVAELLPTAAFELKTAPGSEINTAEDFYYGETRWEGERGGPASIKGEIAIPKGDPIYTLETQSNRAAMILKDLNYITIDESKLGIGTGELVFELNGVEPIVDVWRSLNTLGFGDQRIVSGPKAAIVVYRDGEIVCNGQINYYGTGKEFKCGDSFRILIDVVIAPTYYQESLCDAACEETAEWYLTSEPIIPKPVVVRFLISVKLSGDSQDSWSGWIGNVDDPIEQRNYSHRFNVPIQPSHYLEQRLTFSETRDDYEYTQLLPAGTPVYSTRYHGWSGYRVEIDEVRIDGKVNQYTNLEELSIPIDGSVLNREGTHYLELGSFKPTLYDLDDSEEVRSDVPKKYYRVPSTRIYLKNSNRKTICNTKNELLGAYDDGPVRDIFCDYPVYTMDPEEFGKIRIRVTEILVPDYKETVLLNLETGKEETWYLLLGPTGVESGRMSENAYRRAIVDVCVSVRESRADEWSGCIDLDPTGMFSENEQESELIKIAPAGTQWAQETTVHEGGWAPLHYSDQEYQGWIIELNPDPELILGQELENGIAVWGDGTSQEFVTETETSTLVDIRGAMLEKICEKLEKSMGVCELLILGEFTFLFPGFALDITDEEAYMVSEIPGVKALYPNYGDLRVDVSENDEQTPYFSETCGTSTNAMEEYGFDRVLLTWDPKDITASTCGYYFCDATQFSLMLSKRLPLNEDPSQTFVFPALLLEDYYTSKFKQDFDAVYGNIFLEEDIHISDWIFANRPTEPGKHNVFVSERSDGKKTIRFERTEGLGFMDSRNNTKWSKNLLFKIPFDASLSGAESDYGTGTTGDGLQLNDGINFTNPVRSSSMINMKDSETYSSIKDGLTFKIEKKDYEYDVTFQNSIPVKLKLQSEKNQKIYYSLAGLNGEPHGKEFYGEIQNLFEWQKNMLEILQNQTTLSDSFEEHIGNCNGWNDGQFSGSLEIDDANQELETFAFFPEDTSLAVLCAEESPIEIEMQSYDLNKFAEIGTISPTPGKYRGKDSLLIPNQLENKLSLKDVLAETGKGSMCVDMENDSISFYWNKEIYEPKEQTEETEETGPKPEETPPAQTPKPEETPPQPTVEPTPEQENLLEIIGDYIEGIFKGIGDFLGINQEEEPEEDPIVPPESSFEIYACDFFGHRAVEEGPNRATISIQCKILNKGTETIERIETQLFFTDGESTGVLSSEVNVRTDRIDSIGTEHFPIDFYGLGFSITQAPWGYRYLHYIDVKIYPAEELKRHYFIEEIPCQGYDFEISNCHLTKNIYDYSVIRCSLENMGSKELKHMIFTAHYLDGESNSIDFSVNSSPGEITEIDIPAYAITGFEGFEEPNVLIINNNRKYLKALEVENFQMEGDVMCDKPKKWFYFVEPDSP